MKSSVISVLVMIGLLACGGPKEEKKTDTEAFSELADKEGFAEMHDEPLKLDVNALGVMEKIPMEEGDEANIYSVKIEGAKNYVLVFHEWWGLNNHIIKEADNLSVQLKEQDVAVIAIDLYDGKVAYDRDRAGDLMKGADEKRINNIIASVLNELPDDANIVTIGWCFGGGWSLKAALAANTKTKGCVMYYGMPLEDVDQLAKLNSDVLFVWPKNDKWINEEVVEGFKTNMKAADKKVEVLTFDADHAFANPSSERYVEADAQKANAAALVYLQDKFK